LTEKSRTDFARNLVASSHTKNGHVVIIGGGASGVLLACHLLRGPNHDVRVTLVEKRPEIGRGIAYFTANPNHLLNVRAANMSAFPDQPDHFWQWLCAREGGASEAWHVRGDPFCFAPRTIYGDYIANLISPLTSGNARRLRVVRGECVSISENDSGVSVTLGDGAKHRADIAVLAIGFDTAPSHRASCYVDPWVPPAEASVAPDHRVLIVGTGLTMVDYVLSLSLNGHRGPIFAISRRGLLPRGHRRIEPLSIESAEVPFGEGMTELMRWVRRLVRAQGGDWRSVVDGIRPHSQRIWRELPVSARRSFLEHAKAWWGAHRHRMAPEVEVRIHEAIASGQLSVTAGKLSVVEPGSASVLVRYRKRGASTFETLDVDRIVDCRQMGSAPLKTNNSALRSLVDQGFARADVLRTGIDVTPESAIISRAGVASRRLFAVGPLTRSAFWEIIAIPDIANQCMALADRLRGAPLPSTQALPRSEDQGVG
jgi:uncharacterized NAD(P)/FAD-binding protein YdhS